MEKKNKDNNNNNNKQAPPPLCQEAESNECLNMEDQNPTVKGKNQQVNSPQNDNVSSAAQHYPPAPPSAVIQWPYTPQPTLKQSTLISKPSISTHQTSTVPLNPSSWQMSPLNPPQQPQQQNHIIHHPHGLSHSQMNQSTGAFWVPPGQGFPIARAAGAAAGFQCFVPMGAAEASLRNDPHHNMSFGCQGGFSHPLGYSGPWDPSSWWAQAQQSQPPYTYPGAYGYFALPPLSFPDNLTPFGRPHQRGIIQPRPKLSQKHQQMWEAQSSQNVQLWAAISQLQAEMTTYGSRLTKLESEVSSLKSTVEAYSGAGTGTGTGTGIGAGTGAGTGTGTVIGGKTGKRGRPRKVASSDILLPYTDESQPQPRARKMVSCKAESENKVLHPESLNLEKGNASQVELTGAANIQQENGEKISNIYTNSCNNFQLNGNNLKRPLDVHPTSTFRTQVNQVFAGTQIGGFSLDLRKETKESDNKLRDPRTELSFQPEQVQGANIEITSTTYKESNGNGNYGWTSSTLPDDGGRNLLDMRSQAFYDHGSVSVIRHGGKVVPGWSFVNEGNPSEEHDDSTAVRSGKEEEEDEMEEDANSGDDEMDHRGGFV